MRPAAFSAAIVLAFCAFSPERGDTLDCSTAPPLVACGRVVSSACLARDLATTARDCLLVDASDVVIEGNGHRIRSAAFAVRAGAVSAVTIRNLVSAQDVQLYGGDGHVVERSTLRRVLVFQSDDVTIRDSTLEAVGIAATKGDPVRRAKIVGNIIIGEAGPAIRVTAGHDTPCDAGGDHLIHGNYLIRKRCRSGVPCPGSNVVYFQCNRSSTISENYIQSLRPGRGILFRDEADGNEVIDNWVLVQAESADALGIISGNVDRHHPRDNVFRGNTFIAVDGYSIGLQAQDTRNNLFSENIFAGLGGVGALITDGTENRFDHNTFAGGSKAVAIRNLGTGSTRFDSNIFAHWGDAVLVFGNLVDLAGYRGDHNVFYNLRGPALFGSDRWTFDQWQRRTGQDADSIEANPQFVDANSGDFCLLESSPARGAGENGTDAGALPYAAGRCGP